MEREELVKQIRDSMRIKHTASDDSIKNDIEAAILDLIRVGVQPYTDVESKTLKEDALINKALELYCKGEADFQGKGPQYTVSYEKLRDSMSMCGDYNAR